MPSLTIADHQSARRPGNPPVPDRDGSGLDKVVSRWRRHDHIAAGRGPDALARIADRGVSLAVWLRRFPAPVVAWLDTLGPHAFPTARFIAPAAAPQGLCRAAFAQSPMPVTGERDVLADDCADLISVFADLTGAERVAVRLAVTVSDGAKASRLLCPEFHVDYVSLRLTVAYRGPGTEWLPRSVAARHAAGGHEPERGEIETVPRFAAALFRGRTGECGEALVHRSPPLPLAGMSRFLLCLTAAR